MPSNRLIHGPRAIVGFAIVAISLAACAEDQVDKGNSPGSPDSGSPNGASDTGASTGGDSSVPPTGGDSGNPPTGGDSGNPPTGGDSGNPPTGGDSGEPPPGGDSSTPPTGTPQDAECNFNGRWLVAQRILATAIGQDQAGHNWFYYEVKHDGANLTVTKGLHCGYDVVAKSALAATVDSSPSWPAFLTHDFSTGRKGTFVKDGANCRLHFDKEYVVRGATVAAYLDPTVALPTTAQQASGSTPGWEDWDNDGNPGISLKVTSTLASGTLYTAQRDWTQYDGATPLSTSKFQVAATWDGEQVALGRSAGSSSAIEGKASPSSDTTQHFVWFYKFADGQGVGSDADICQAVRTLKDTLVPEATQ